MVDTLSVRRWALALKTLTILAMIGLGLVLSFGILFAPVPPDMLEAARITDPSLISGTRRAAIAFVGAIPALVLLYILAQMARLFSNYAQGDLLSRDCARSILRIGAGVLVMMVLDIVSRPLQGLVTTMANPPGSREVSLALHGMDLGQLLAGGLLIMIGWSMVEAARVAEENEAFV